ncbi:MAG: ATPase, T2SS/T4P/T4SS family, partial [Anaerolineae bacterium]
MSHSRRLANLPPYPFARWANDVAHARQRDLETLRRTKDVEDIAINGPQEVYIFRRGRWEPVADIAWDSEEELLELLNRAIAPTGRQISPLRPVCDAILPNGDRINVVIRPCAKPSPCVSIRARATERISFLDLVSVPQHRGIGRRAWNVPDYTLLAQEDAMLDAVTATFLHMAVVAGTNILVVGSTGVGKTTVLSALGELIHEGIKLSRDFLDNLLLLMSKMCGYEEE